MENGMTENELIEAAAANGVRVYGLSRYYIGSVSACPPATVVLGYAGIPSEQISSAVSALERAWKR